MFISQSRFKGRRRGPPDSEPPAITATLVDSSSQPLYDAEIRWHPSSEDSGKPNPEPIGTVLPGASSQFMRKFPFEATVGLGSCRDVHGVCTKCGAGGGVSVTYWPGGVAANCWRTPGCAGRAA